MPLPFSERAGTTVVNERLVCRCWEICGNKDEEVGLSSELGVGAVENRVVGSGLEGQCRLTEGPDSTACPWMLTVTVSVRMRRSPTAVFILCCCY